MSMPGKQIARSQAGIGRVAIIATLLVLIIVGIVGYKLYANGTKTTTEATSQSPTDPVAIKSNPISSTSDIDTAISALNQNDPITTSNDDFTAFNNQTQALQ